MIRYLLPMVLAGVGRLRFTRFNVTRDGFESRRDYTEDGGRNWKPGNHQRLRRSDGPGRLG